MRQQTRCGPFFKRQLHDFARVDTRAVDRAAEELDVLDDPVALVREDDAEDFVIEVPQTHGQILAHLLVMGCHASWNFGRGKPGGKIQVKANIKTVLGGNTRSAGGILHENHTAGRGKHAVLETLEGSIGGSAIATPVVGVDYETAAKGRLQTRIRSRRLARVGRLGL